ncbi:MAG: PEP-CTERM sorting domain-containing protein [Oceanipulchritudo sp.]|jgi:hypothetical protein
MKKLLYPLSIALIPSLAFAIINFENYAAPGDADNANITALPWLDNGTAVVTFSFQNGPAILEDANTGETVSFGPPREELPGDTVDDPYGFSVIGSTLADWSGSYDGIGSGPDLGNYFLRSQGDTDFGVFRATYTWGYANYGQFQIWDIDSNSQGFEQYRVTLYDSGNNVLDDFLTVSSEDVNLDGLPYLVTFDVGTAQVTKIEVRYVGNKTTTIGLAFDNFESFGAAIPEPSTYAAILGLAAIGLVLLRRRRR